MMPARAVSGELFQLPQGYALLSSLEASVTVKLLGFFFFFKIAVAVSSTWSKVSLLNFA
jgi:hypothetical protein